MLHFLQVSHLADYTTVVCGFCKGSNSKLLTMDRQGLPKAYSKMGVEGSFTLGFTAVFKHDPATPWCEEDTAGAADLYLEKD